MRVSPSYGVVACTLFGFMPALVAAQTVQQQIDDIFDALPGSHTLSGRVESEDGSTVYYTHDASTTKKPASVTKTFMVGASLSLLGEDHQFVTKNVFKKSFIPGRVDGASRWSWQ